MARPRIVWEDDDYKLFESLCGIYCTEDDICSVMNVSDKTLNRLLQQRYKLSFSDCFKKFSANGRITLRKKQFEVAKAGNVTMLIWLGKQYLGQTDKQEVTEVQYVEDLSVLADMIQQAKERGE